MKVRVEYQSLDWRDDAGCMFGRLSSLLLLLFCRFADEVRDARYSSLLLVREGRWLEFYIVIDCVLNLLRFSNYDCIICCCELIVDST